MRSAWLGTVWITGSGGGKSGKLDKPNYETLVYPVKELLCYSIGTKRDGVLQCDQNRLIWLVIYLLMSGLHQLHTTYQAEVLGNITESCTPRKVVVKCLPWGQETWFWILELSLTGTWGQHTISLPLSFSIHRTESNDNSCFANFIVLMWGPASKMCKKLSMLDYVVCVAGGGVRERR